MTMDQLTPSPHDSGNDCPHEANLRLGQRLRSARIARNLTQGEVAKDQFSASYISGIERGQILPSLGAPQKLAERLQVPITDLLADGEFTVRSAP
jgi:transcriptional regulator with XRE-family HTH domain